MRSNVLYELAIHVMSAQVGRGMGLALIQTLVSESSSEDSSSDSEESSSESSEEGDKERIQIL